MESSDVQTVRKLLKAIVVQGHTQQTQVSMGFQLVSVYVLLFNKVHGLLLFKGPCADHFLILWGSTGSSTFFDIK